MRGHTRRSGRITAAFASVLISSLLVAPATAADMPSPLEATEETADATRPAKTASSGSVDAEDSGASSEGAALRVKVAGRDIVVIGETESRAGEETSSGGHVISVLGNELAGTDSEARGGSSHSRTGFGHDLCENTDGLVCLALLYADARSEDDGERSSSSADTRVASLCVDGEQNDPSEPCGSLASAGVLESYSSSQNDANGEGSAEHSSTVARLCVNDNADTPGCDGVGIALLQRSVNSDGDESSEGLSVSLGGEELSRDHPGDLGICDGGTLCVEPNHGSATGGGGPGSGATPATPGLASARAEGHVIEIEVLGREIVKAGATQAQTDGDGASADVTVLSLLGHELIGAHSQTNGGDSEAETGYLDETCETTDQICLSLLYGRAQSSEDASASQGESHTAGGALCVGGEGDAPAEEPCTGAVGATVLEGHSQASQDKDEGTAEAQQDNVGADVCLGGENDEGACDGVGIVVLEAHSRSAAGPGTRSGEAEASTITIERGGEDAFEVEGPQTIGVPSYCPEDSAVLCVALNDVDTDADAPSRATAATAIVGQITGGVGAGSVSDGSADAQSPKARVLGTVEKRKPDPAPAVSGVLGKTGAPALMLAAFALLLTTAGLLARRAEAFPSRQSRRRQGVARYTN